MNNRSIEHGFLDPNQATKEAVHNAPWKPFQLASRVTPTPIPVRNNKRYNNKAPKYIEVTQSQISSIHSTTVASTVSNETLGQSTTGTQNPYSRAPRKTSNTNSVWNQQYASQGATSKGYPATNPSTEVLELKQLVEVIQKQVNASSQAIETMTTSQREYRDSMNKNIKSNQQAMQQQLQQHTENLTVQQQAFEATQNAKIVDLTNKVTNQCQDLNDDVKSIISVSSASVEAKFEQLLLMMKQGGQPATAVRRTEDSMDVESDPHHPSRTAHPEAETTNGSRDGRTSPALSI
jgi:hypothetical protein